MIFRGKRSRINRKFTMDVDPAYKSIEKIRRGVQGYMMDKEDFVSSISFKLKTENNKILSFNGQSITFFNQLNDFFYWQRQ